MRGAVLAHLPSPLCTQPAQTGSLTAINGSLVFWGVIPVTVYSSLGTHT